MIKILHIVTRLATGGAEKYLYNLVTSMDKSTFDNRVVSLIEPDSVGDDLQRAGIPVSSIGMKRGMAGPFSVMRLASIIKREKPDIIQTWLYHSDLLGTFAARLSGAKAPVIWNIRCTDMLGGNRIKPLYWVIKLLAMLSRSPHTVIANSKSGMEFHRNFGYQPKQWQIIYNGIDTDKFKPDPGSRDHIKKEFGIEKDKFLVGLVGRFDPVKGIETFIKSARLVSQKYPGAKFILIGSGMDNDNTQLNEWLNKYSLRDFFTLAGKRDDMNLITSGLDVSASSSISEGFSNTIGEAMSCGVICVATDVGDSKALIGEWGIIVPPQDEIAMADGILSVIEMDDTERKSIGEMARKRIAVNFPASTSIDEYVRLYESALGNS